MKNTFAKVEGSIKSSYTIFYAPKGASEDECIAAGYKQFIDSPPECGPSEIVILDEIEEDDSTITMKYSKVHVSHKPVPVIISKYKFIAKLMEMNLWIQVKQLLEDNGLLDLFSAAQELNTEDQFFKQGLQLAKAKLGITDEQMQQFIEQVAA